MLSKKIKKGFTLIELILVISVGLTMSFLSFQNMIRNQEDTQSSVIGEQLKKIGDSTNLYITNHYQELSSLQNSTSTTSDPGPRTCVTATQTCSINIQTLIYEGLLPPTYKLSNIVGSGYNITLKRSGTAPYYVITGLVLTDTPLITGNSNVIRYDMLGKAMQKAGVDSGMTRVNSGILEGFKGTWNNTSADYSNINKIGLLGYQVGYGSNSYSVYLRRDGTLPMTGSLNMNGNDIINAKNITATGNIKGGTLESTGDTNIGGNLNVDGTSSLTGAVTTASSVTAAGKIRSNSYFEGQNGGGDGFRIGGSDSNDVEFALYTAKPLTVWRSGGASNESRFQVYGRQINTGDFALNASPDGLSSGAFTAAGKIRSESYFEGKNGGGDGFRIGGSDSNDIEFALYTANKPLTVWRNGGASNESRFHVMGSQTISGDLKLQAGSDSTTTGQIQASGNLQANTLLATSTVAYGDNCTVVGTIAKDNLGNSLICSINKKMVKSSSVIEVFSQDLTGTLPIITNLSNMISYCSTSGQQQYTITIKPIQDEVFSTAFTTSLTPASAANSPTSGADYDKRIALIRSGTSCVLINNAVCTAQSNIEPGRTGAVSCIKELKANQTYNILYVLGNNTEATMSASRFLVQYMRIPL